MQMVGVTIPLLPQAQFLQRLTLQRGKFDFIAARLIRDCDTQDIGID